MRFVICHVYNERYLLNWWLRHHKNKFDHGIIIDYHSTDGSMDLVREITPTWQVITSNNKDFNAANCDAEVMAIEAGIQRQYPYAWMITLNATEFLIGNTEKLITSYKPSKRVRMQKLIPCDVMIDSDEHHNTEPDSTKSLVSQRTFGMPCDYSEDTIYNAYNGKRDYQAITDNVMYDNRKMRSMHNFPINYFETSVWGAGRHYWGTPSEDFRILWYGYSPFNENLIKRKLGVQTQIPEADKRVGNGGQHLLDKNMAILRYRWHKQFAVDLSDQILELENGS